MTLSIFYLIRQMAEVVSDTSDFETNILSFWILDMFIEGLWTAQNAGMGFQHQKVTLLWIAYFFNHIIRKIFNDFRITFEPVVSIDKISLKLNLN